MYHFVKRKRNVDETYDVLDDTRIHPEDYDLARKMAADALEVDDTFEEGENPSQHVRELMEGETDRLNLLMLDDYAVELEKTLGQPKKICLNEIKDELMRPYKERRRKFESLGVDETFALLTNETSESLDRDMVIGCQVAKVSERVVKVVLPSGLEGMIGIKNLSDKSISTCTEAVQVGQYLDCLILNIDRERFFVELSARERDVEEGKMRMERMTAKRDVKFDQDAEHDDNQRRNAEMKRKVAKQRRAIQHPFFKPLDYRGAEAYLKDRPVGDVVIRPSTKGNDHMSITWKIDPEKCQHLGITCNY
jgi:transcription elongation factor SPT6